MSADVTGHDSASLGGAYAFPNEVRGGMSYPFDTLQAITRRMATAEDLEAVLGSITDALVQDADAVVAGILLLREDDKCAECRAQRLRTGTSEPALHLAAVSGNRHPEVFSAIHHVPLDSDLPAAVLLRARRPIIQEDWRKVSDLPRAPLVERAWAELGVVGVAGYPLEFQGEQLGVVGVLSSRAFGPEEVEMVGMFADQAAMAIKNAYLFRELASYEERLRVENAYLQDEIRVDQGFEHIVGESAALRDVLRKVRQVSRVETTVLLTGETGTGKELIARAIHEESPRKDRPMIKINCGAIPQGTVESELFGHEKGAFTGALQQRIGRFELADKGTLFMDEVGELTLETQVKLLRVLQEREFERVGSAKPIRTDVRLVAATNRDLEQEVKEGRFRSDLFYRLNVFPIHIPALRERPDDIPLLVRHFLAHFQRKLGKPLRSVTSASMQQMQLYAWPGNIRELQNVLERACVLARGPEVELADVLRASPGNGPVASGAPIATLADHQRSEIRRALAAANGRIHGPKGAAAMLGVKASTLRSRMQKLGIALK